MKTYMKTLLTSALLLLVLVSVTPVFAQEPPHPPSTGHGQLGNQNPSGSTAPIGSGLQIMLVLGTILIGSRANKTRRENDD